jgi:hypothetical protein
LIETGVVVSPRRDAETGRISLPEVPGGQVQLVECEAGGGSTSTGWAACVASLDGEPLKPFGTAGHRGHLCNATHAWFAIEGGLVTAQAGYRAKSEPTTSVTLCEHRWIDDGGNTGHMVSQQLFRGTLNELPAGLEKFRAVLEAAARKATCYHCRCVHFSA